MDTRVFKDNNYVVRYPFLERKGGGSAPQIPAVGLNISAFFAAEDGGEPIGPAVTIALAADVDIPGLYGGIITGAGITTEMFSNGRNYDRQFVWLRLRDPAAKLNLSLRRTAYANRNA